MFARLLARAGVAVIAEVRATVFAFVAAEREAELAQAVEHGEQEPPAIRQRIFDVRGAAAVVAAFDECILFHIAESADECAAADGVERVDEFGRAARRARQIAHDEQRPFIADHL